MKKRIAGIIVATGLLLLVSCGPKVNVNPAEPTGSAVTPTAAEMPTFTPGAEISPQATSIPEPTVTSKPELTAVPTPVLKPTEEPQPTETPVPAPTGTEEPTGTPEPTEEIVPTEEPEPTTEPTVPPEPTTEPEPTEGAIPTETPEPTPSPTPVLNPETLVNQGWQKTASFDGKYSIIFPDLFRESVVTKEEKELLIKYTCIEEAEIEFRISYVMQQTLEEAENAVLSAGGTILEGSLGEKRVVLEWKEDGVIYRGVLREEQYLRVLLGDTFGEEEWITGVMQVIFAYPEDRREEFETAEFNYYVKQNREE